MPLCQVLKGKYDKIYRRNEKNKVIVARHHVQFNCTIYDVLINNVVIFFSLYTDMVMSSKNKMLCTVTFYTFSLYVKFEKLFTC
ncbi:hypothetical protein XELAEV_18047489mg [Xenopus laevis]|uniref:Uncharacterized protein n=1 Tax=Xenopus laevis TaxID=8355 RepID=A0A974BV87_XENLA|nr:hypothetical protein XELAEV_18047489mg [Xenopus laevis]